MSLGTTRAAHAHRAHDYRFLTQRWSAVAKAAGVRVRRFFRDEDRDLLCLQTRALRSDGGIYISAGIHGDEAASTEALVTWAERNVTRLGELPLCLFPCLNPWGLVNNMRVDRTGTDRNRCFHCDELAWVQAVKACVGDRRFAAALMLHEDYDAQGMYLYEVQREQPFWGEALLQAAATVIPIEGRVRVDGRKPHGGIIRRRVNHQRFAQIGYPEAIWLHTHHSARTFTMETPSEFALEQRVEAHVSVIDECVRRVLG
jgi:hypothetical protein